MNVKITLLCFALTGAAIAAFVSLSPRQETITSEPAVNNAETQALSNNDASPEAIPSSSSSEVGEQDDVSRDEPISALASYPGFGHDADKDEAMYSVEEERREHMIAGCMEASGFEYTPAPSVLIDDEVMADPEALDALLNEMAVDPNAEYVLSLSQDQQRSYNVALYGMENPNEAEADAHEQALEADSCTNQAFAEVPGVYAKRNALSEQVDEMERSILASPELLAANAQWSECMQQKGYSFSKASDLDRQADELMGVLYEGVDPQEVLNLEQLEPTLSAIVSDPSLDQDSKIEKTTSSLNAIAELVSDCDNSTGLTQQQQRIRIEHENAFAKKYAAQLN